MLHAAEIARFDGHVVCGPTASDCNIWTGAIGADGYGRFCLTLDGVGFCMRPHRYALAIAGGSMAAGVLSLHECDDPVCVKNTADSDPQQHVVAGSQSDNMLRLAADASRWWTPCVAALREPWCAARSVGGQRGGAPWWDAAAAQAAILGDQPMLW
ncbi:MAG: hypothetical protein WBN99_18785 [Mycobacterium sp.]|nr:hypothetical protein [Mycobacterium sp.]